MDKPIDPDPRRAQLDRLDAEAERGGGEARVAKVDTESDPTLAARFGIRSIPTLVAFRNGREVIVTVRRHGQTYVGEKDSLTTKCPSKFTDKSTPGGAESS